MNANELIEALQELTPEQREESVVPETSDRFPQVVSVRFREACGCGCQSAAVVLEMGK